MDILFRNFGPLIHALHLTGKGDKCGMDESELLTLVKTYCPSLKELTLDDIGNDDDDDFNCTELVPLFGGLEKLSVSSADVCDSFGAILSDCHDLKYLNVGYVPATMWMNHKFPKLETLVISINWAFESFLKFHENLETLIYDDVDILSSVFPTLSKTSLKLETFHCNIAEIDDDDEDLEKLKENILQLSKLKSLRNVTFTCEASTLNLLVDAFAKECTPIEHFEIVGCPIDRELIVGLSKLTKLKTLKLTRCEISKETLVTVNKLLNGVKMVIIKEFDLEDHLVPLAENVRVVSSKTLIRKRPNLDQGSSDILNILNDDCLVGIFEFLPFCVT